MINFVKNLAMKKILLLLLLVSLAFSVSSCKKKSSPDPEPTPQEILTGHDWIYDNLNVSNGASSSDTPQNIRFVFSKRHYYTHNSSGDIIEHGDYTIDDKPENITLTKSTGAVIQYHINSFSQNEMEWQLQNGNFTYTLHFSAQ